MKQTRKILQCVSLLLFNVPYNVLLRKNTIKKIGHRARKRKAIITYVTLSVDVAFCSQELEAVSSTWNNVIYNI